MIILCGKKALDPVSVSEVCRDNPREEVYALPWISTEAELAANFSINKTVPSRVFPCEPNTDKAEGEFEDFDPSLIDYGDAFGRMAKHVSSGFPAINEVMRCHCASGFYNKVLVREGVSTFLLDCHKADRYFPAEPLSAKLYAATTVPVRFRNTSSFAEESGWVGEFVNVIMASDFLPGSSAFINFYHLMSKRFFVGVAEKFRGRNMLRFRYNRMYKE